MACEFDRCFPQYVGSNLGCGFVWAIGFWKCIYLLLMCRGIVADSNIFI